MIIVIIADLLAVVCVLSGLAFMLVGAIGIVRFPDAFNRLHASSKCSTLGLLGLLLGVIFHIGTLGVVTKAVITIVFAFVALPIGSHILAKAAHIDGLRQWSKTLSDELAEDYPERTQRDEAVLDADPDFPGGGGGGSRRSQSSAANDDVVTSASESRVA
jgi:multicomponent Na+:H+ antiporter subunit G